MTRFAFMLLLIKATGIKGNHHDKYLKQFYDDLVKGDTADVVDRYFHDDAIYAHTGLATATGKDELKALIDHLRGGVENVPQLPKILDTQIAGGKRGAQAFNAVRKGLKGLEREQAVRDSIFVVEGKIRAMMTTLSSPKDPEAKPLVNTDIKFAPNPHDVKLKEEIQKAVNVYFEGFGTLNPEKMQSAYEKDIFYMFDFNPDRHTPFGCFADPGVCSRAPFMTDRDQLLPAFKGFASGYVKLNHTYPIVDVYGDMALATSVSLGCEGNMVTPKGSKPMPNREHFLMLKKEGVWKIHTYMFTYDPKSPLQPPVAVCPPQAMEDAIIV